MRRRSRRKKEGGICEKEEETRFYLNQSIDSKGSKWKWEKNKNCKHTRKHIRNILVGPTILIKTQLPEPQGRSDVFDLLKTKYFKRKPHTKSEKKESQEDTVCNIYSRQRWTFPTQREPKPHEKTECRFSQMGKRCERAIFGEATCPGSHSLRGQNWGQVQTFWHGMVREGSGMI